DVLGLFLEDPVGRLQILGVGGLGQRRAEAAALGDRGGDVVLLAAARLVVLVGQQVLRQAGLPDRGADYAVAPEADLKAIPVSVVAAEDAGDGPEGDAEGAEEEGVGDVVGGAGQVGQREAGADGEGLAGGLEPNAAQAQAELLRGAVILEAVAQGEGFGGQLGVVAEAAIEPSAETLRFIGDLGVRVVVDGQADRRTGAGQGSPPRCAGYSKGDSWPLPSLCPLYARLLVPPAPQSMTVRKKGRRGSPSVR